MLRAAPPGHPLQKPTVVQWDIGAMLSADGAADESVSPQSGITANQTVMTPYFKSIIGFDPDGIGRIHASTWIEARQEARNCIRNRPETALTAWRFEPLVK